MRALALLAAAGLAVAARAGGAPDPGAAPGDALERRREAVAVRVLRLGPALRGELERGDVPALLARVPADGLRCGDRAVPRARVARDLAAPGSWLHGVLFGGPGFSPPPGTAPSLAALLRAEGEVALVVSFVVDPRAGELGRPCLDFRAKGVRTPGVPFCFEERGGRWWLVDSLYPCG